MSDSNNDPFQFLACNTNGCYQTVDSSNTGDSRHCKGCLVKAAEDLIAATKGSESNHVQCSKCTNTLDPSTGSVCYDCQRTKWTTATGDEPPKLKQARFK